MPIDILDSDCVEFFALVERRARNRVEAQQAHHAIDAAVGVLGTLSRGYPKWVPDNEPVDDAETCLRLRGVIRSLQALTARYGEVALLRKLSDVCSWICAKLAHRSAGPLAQAYATLHAQIARGPASHADPDQPDFTSRGRGDPRVALATGSVFGSRRQRQPPHSAH